MTTKITAAEARKIAGPTDEEIINDNLNYAYGRIREAADKKARRALLTNDFWTHGGYESSKNWKQAVKTLEEDGFKVTFFYEERQFVNMYTVAEW
jgi:peptidoglycan/xylan/chitin deacetylase (PgdA/CDA1 family)